MNADRTRVAVALSISITVHGAVVSLGGISDGGAYRPDRFAPVAVTIASIAEPEVHETADAEKLPGPKQHSQDQKNHQSASAAPEDLVEVKPVPVEKSTKSTSLSETKTVDPAEPAVDDASKKNRTQAPDGDSVDPTVAAAAAATDRPASTRGTDELTGISQAAIAEFSPAPVHPDVTAVPLYHLIPKPAYPSRSRDLGEEGLVIVAVLVGKDGSVLEAHVSKSSGFPLLDGSALAVVTKKWRFRPGMKHGDAVPSWVRVPIKFSIKGS